MGFGPSAEQLPRIYEEGGDEALSEFVRTNPFEFIEAVEAFFIVENDNAPDQCHIAWETEVWIAENPDHMIHFDGKKFLGPY